MTTATYNPQEFSVKVQGFEKQAYDFAIANATEIAQKKTNILEFVVARRICNRAFKIFSESIKAEFPQSSYSSLIDLNLSEKGGERFVRLEQMVISILSKPSPKSEGLNPGAVRV